MRIVSFDAQDAYVTGYIHEDHDRLVAHRTRPAIVICAGGGYRWLSPREKDPVALSFAAMGYQTFLIEYSTGERAGGLRPLHELAEAVRTIRARAEEWHIEPNHIAVLGFSAGGHLAASLGILWEKCELGVESRPDALVLCYPVISMFAQPHEESKRNVTGGDPAMEPLLSLEWQVTNSMPPCFVWHCVGDESVSVINSILLVDKMQDVGVPYECHLFSGGAHGISMCSQEVETPYPNCEPWIGLCKTWLNNLFQYTP